MILPAGLFSLGAGLNYVTADGGLSPLLPIKFTDLVLLDLDGRYSVAGKAELLAGVSLLPKQPSYTNESPWQGAYLGARLGFAKRYAAGLRAAFGPLMFGPGSWGTVETGLQGRSTLSSAVLFQGGVGSAATWLSYRPRTSRPFWIAEAMTSAEIVLRSPQGQFAAWVGSEFRFPFHSTPGREQPDPSSGRFVDARTRVNFHVGTVVALARNWDVFMRWIVVDRGDLVRPSTTLPILPGGFDQRHLVIGMVRRFRAESSDRGPKLPLGY
ncbi:MAG: hypothetical protein MJD61_03410 [Proteobacteria bacterium]|nr:hypothetical protein [Pseudomonadota bacterium]